MLQEEQLVLSEPFLQRSGCEFRSRLKRVLVEQSFSLINC